MAGDHTPMLKSKLGFLKLESLQALSNVGFRVEETSAFVVCVCVLVLMTKIKPEYFIWYASAVVPPSVILLAFLAVMSEIFLSFTCVTTWVFQNMLGEQV